VGHVSRSSSVLRVKTSPTRISKSSIKTVGGVMMGGVRDTIVEVASESS
jgi:hypothetical protein